MKIKIEPGYIAIISPKLTWLCAWWSGQPERVRAVAIFPCMIFRSTEDMVPWVINHERIHFRQQLEMAIVGHFVWSFCEMLYGRLVLGKRGMTLYLWLSSEQEAYRNHHHTEYLAVRPWFAQFRYVRDKKAFTVGPEGEITYTPDN